MEPLDCNHVNMQMFVSKMTPYIYEYYYWSSIYSLPVCQSNLEVVGDRCDTHSSVGGWGVG